MTTLGPLRTGLFVPGNRPDRVDKAVNAGADAVIIDREDAVAFGAADYALDLGIEMTRQGEELTYPRSRIAIACRAAGVDPPLDTPFMIDPKDLEGLKADAIAIK